jgi:HNH endonuclease
VDPSLILAGGGAGIAALCGVGALLIGGASQDTKDWVAVSSRSYRPKGTVYIPLELGQVTLDLQPGLTDILHAAIGGTSRLGKSSALMGLYDVPIGVLTVALDDTVPISRKVRSVPDGVEWTSDPSSPVGLDLLNYPASIVSEVLVGGFGTVGSGKWQRIARDRLWQAMLKLDAAGEQRTFEGLSSALMQPIPGDGEGTRACQDWAHRLIVLSHRLGPALGPGLNLVDAMRHQQKVLLRMNRFLSPLDAPMLGGMLLVHSRMVAVEAGVPFVLVVEEAGQMQQYQSEISPLCQAGGARGVSVVLITQNLSKLPPEVVNNISIWATFAQEEQDDINFAAHKMRLKPAQLHREAFPGKGDKQGRGWCYVRAPGVPTTLVQIKNRVPNVSPSPVKVPNRVLSLEVPTFDALAEKLVYAPEQSSDQKPVNLVENVEPRPAWIGDDPDWQRAVKFMRRQTEPSLLWHPDKGFRHGEPCLAWTGGGGIDSEEKYPRPKFKILGSTVTVYIETFKLAGGVIPESWTLDHLCANAWCVEPEHLEAVTNAENNKRRSGRKKALAAMAA